MYELLPPRKDCLLDWLAKNPNPDVEFDSIEDFMGDGNDFEIELSDASVNPVVLTRNIGRCPSCGKQTLFLDRNIVMVIECPGCGNLLRLDYEPTL